MMQELIALGTWGVCMTGLLLCWWLSWLERTRPLRRLFHAREKYLRESDDSVDQKIEVTVCTIAGGVSGAEAARVRTLLDEGEKNPLDVLAAQLRRYRRVLLVTRI